ncbi:poly-beta-1,6-N-acetyl-D-glucosamine N-deacetylase PgaB [Ottowia sp.]|uniref:poly-beta-1,6-N-acetyl-D-glucosamine N-deacetylase PgaB n=1 Tax=Ottowia sp. TaxID=1898956 RepID=UPI003A884E9D
MTHAFWPRSTQRFFSRHWIAALLLSLAACCTLPVHAQPLPTPDPDDGATFRVLAFHDVRYGVLNSFETDPEESAVDASVLAGLFDWLRRNDYHPISLQQVVDAREGRKALPPRAVLLTFDDGYVSFYTRIFPLLKAYNYPAVMNLVTSWLEVRANGHVDYGNSLKPRSDFLSWAQAREMVQSGLIELASHSHDMHHGVPSNPLGSVQPAATTHQWNKTTAQYETDAEYSARIETDLRQSKATIEARTGQPVRAIAWPYGAYNDIAAAAAQRVGLTVGFSLVDGPANTKERLDRIPRGYASYQLAVNDYERLLRTPHTSVKSRGTRRVVHVDLDYVYDTDPAQIERNLSALIDRIHAIGPSTVYLQAFADPDGDGVAQALYFPNRHLPVRADLFDRVAWQLRTRTGVQVFAWMPVMAFGLAYTHPLKDVTVQMHGTSAADAAPRYHRLSPFDARTRQLISDIYDDLGRYTAFAGVLFHDDAMLGDDEDASAAALKTYAQWGLPASIDTIRADPALRARWATAKSDALTAFTLELADVLRRWQPDLLTARNFYARPVIEPAATEWFAQNFARDIQRYDYSAIMAMPAMEEARNADAWLGRLAKAALSQPGAANHTVFELQARDWRTGQPIADDVLQRQARLLRELGVRHLGYYPDDFSHNQPDLSVARRHFSVRRTLPNALRQALTPNTSSKSGTPAAARASEAVQ